MQCQASILRRILWRAAAFASVLLSIAPFPARAAITVEWKNERLSVTAEQAPLAQILREIAQRVGVEIRGGEGLQAQVSVCFADLPLQDGLQKLSLNYLVLWKTAPSDGQRPVLAVVSAWKGPASPQPCVIRAAKEAVTIPTRPALPVQQERTSDEKPKVREAASALLTGTNPQEALAALIEGAKSERAKTRLEALRALSQSDHVEEDVVLSALQTALTDDAEDVRGYAEQILKEREALHGE